MSEDHSKSKPLAFKVGTEALFREIAKRRVREVLRFIEGVPGLTGSDCDELRRLAQLNNCSVNGMQELEERIKAETKILVTMNLYNGLVNGPLSVDAARALVEQCSVKE